MNVLMHNRHIPHAHMMITAMPDVHFDVLGWYGNMRPVPENARYVTRETASSFYDASIDDDWIEYPIKEINSNNRILLLHCEHDGGNPDKQRWLNQSMWDCDRAVVVSQHKRLTMRELGLDSKVSAIPFGFDVDKFPKSDHSSKLAGAMHNGLDISEEIQSFAASVLGVDDLLIGHKNTKGDMRRIQPESQQECLYALSSLGIFVNIVCGESFGMSPCEAMACGIPVVTGNCIDAAEIAFDDWNICMPRLPALQAIDWIKDKIAQLKSDQALRKRIGSAGRETIRHLFNHHLLRDRWMEVLS